MSQMEEGSGEDAARRSRPFPVAEAERLLEEFSSIGDAAGGQAKRVGSAREKQNDVALRRRCYL